MADAGRSTFVPAGLGGLALAALGAVASQKHLAAGAARTVATPDLVDAGSSRTLPVAGALALVAVAAWAVALVLRGRARRALLGVAGVGALGGLVVLLTGFDPSSSGSGFDASRGHTGWFWVALVCAAGAVVCALVGVRTAAAWPEMGSRYDAPAGAASAADDADDDPRSMWKALDEGRDPTD